MSRVILSIGACLIALTLLAAPLPTSAEVYTVTYTGVVEPGDFNPGALFGGGDLTGDAFVAKFWYDPAVGVRQTVPGVSDTLSGPGAVNGLLTINGHAEYFPGDHISEAYTEAGDIWDETVDFSGNTQPSRNLVVVFFGDDATDSLESSVPLSGGADGGSEFYIGALDSQGQYADLSSYSLIAATVSVSLPEPAAWALMLVGFAGLGAGLRLCRSVAWRSKLRNGV